MIIKGGVLLYVDDTDLDASGVLRIPEGVTRLPAKVGNSLKGLTSIVLPNSLTEIKTKVFSDNPSLTSVYFGDNIHFLALNAFSNCLNLHTISIPNARMDMVSPCTFQNLKCIIRRNADGSSEKYPVKKHAGIYYYEEKSRTIGEIKVSKVYNVYFHDDFTKNIPLMSISIERRGRNTFIAETLKKAVTECRKYVVMQEFEREVWKYKAKHETNENLFETCESILRGAIKKCIQNPYQGNLKQRIQTARSYIKKTPTYLRHLEKFCVKYKNTDKKLAELTEISMEKLLQKIMPIKSKTQPVSKSCTHWLKKHPVSADEMFSIVSAGYKNPGAFPYDWLKKIPESDRGNITRRLHRLFKRATIELYSPNVPMLQYVLNEDALLRLSQKISNIIYQPVKITYLGSGCFSKTYSIEIDDGKKYVWKVYHCDVDDDISSRYYHDTELQNSFLFSGKKYSGSTKFRRISTAGISNQRGEMYLIYPYTNALPSKNRIYRMYENVRKYSLVDSNSDNFLGHTIIDTGAIQINYKNWNQPRFISKITHTVLYQSWNDLNYVLNNYSSNQINDALTFIESRTSRNSLEFNKIQSKIEFLKQHIKVR